MDQLNANEKNVINVIRKLSRDGNRRNFSKNDIATTLGIQWTTVSNSIDSINREKTSGKGLIDNESLKLDPSYEYYAGISLGSSRVKFVIVDFCFNVVSTECISECEKAYTDFIKKYSGKIEREDEDSDKVQLCLNINNDPEKMGFNSITLVLDDLCKMLVNMKKSGFNIGAVGFAFPGKVDFNGGKIISTYVFENAGNIGLEDLIDQGTFKDFKELFGDENGICKYCFDQNSTAAIIAEKEAGCITSRDAAVIYGGYGYGLGVILGNRLYSSICGGQIGHMAVVPYKFAGTNDFPRCRCGQVNCLENRINYEVFGKIAGKEWELKSKKIDELCKILTEDKKSDIFAYYLAQALNNLIQLMGVKNIVFTGKLAKLYPCISWELKNRLFAMGLTTESLQASEFGEFSGAIGIAIEAYYKKYNIPLEWKY